MAGPLRGPLAFVAGPGAARKCYKISMLAWLAEKRHPFALNWHLI